MLRNRNNALVLLDNLRSFGYSDTEILNMIVGDYLSGSQAYDTIEHVYEELGLKSDEE